MVLINNLTVDEINAALIHLQRSRNEVVGGEKGDTVQNITINNQGGGADYSSVINAIENRVKNTETNINTLDSSQRMLALETAGMQEQIAVIYNTLLSMSQNNITDISWDDTNRVLVINTTSMSYEVAIPSETVALSLEGNVLTFTMGEQTTSVTLNYIPTSEKGVANGVATLDSSGRIPYSQLPESAMEFLGEWDASTNTPHLEDGEGDNGDFYVVSVGGTVNFGTQAEPRNITFYPNDRVVYEGSLEKWFRLPAGEVRTVNGLSGDVILNGTNVNYDGTNNSPTLKSKIDSVETKAETQADWNISDSSNLAYIKNKPALKTVAVTGSYNDLTNKPTIPAAQIQSDWTQTDTTKKDFIKNKIPIWISEGSASDNMQPVDSVTEGETRPVTSNGVAEIMKSLPTDAVLHYSFDEVPDLPDGTAVYRKNNDWTANDNWSSDGTCSIEVSNGKLTMKGVTNNYNYAFKTLTATSPIVMVRCSYSATGSIALSLNSGALRQTLDFSANETKTFIVYFNGNLSSISVGGIAYDETLTISQLYIGDGSYTTPVIDNANGQNNGTNNGGIAVQGVSGKGISFNGVNSYIYGNLPFNPYYKKIYSVSCWVKNWDMASTFMILNNWSTYQVSSLQLSVNATGTHRVAIAVNMPDGTIKRYINQTYQLTSDFFICGVCNGANSKIYINGVEVPISLFDSMTPADIIKERQFFQSGRHKGDGGYVYSKADIDDLLIFNRALSQEEVTALYLNKANTPKYYSWADWKLSQI